MVTMATTHLMYESKGFMKAMDARITNTHMAKQTVGVCGMAHSVLKESS